MTLDFDVMAEGLAMPEGPVVMPDGSVILVEMVAGTLTRCWGDGRKEVVATPGGGPNGLALGPDGAMYVANNGGLDMEHVCQASGPGCEGRIERVDLATGKVERIQDRCGDHYLSAPNDLVFDRTGGLWFTDLGKMLRRSTEYSGLYYMPAGGGKLREAHYGAVSYNGVGLSPDERTVYAACTSTAKLWAFDLVGPGELAEPSGAIEMNGQPSQRRLVGTAPEDVHFDSLALTENGDICVATIGHGGVSVFSPDGYKHRVDVPDVLVTNIAFGGEDMRTAVFTCTGTGRLLRARWPEPGLRLNFQS